MNRAVITGIGVVSPLGMNWPTWVDGLRTGRSGTRRITLFDPLRPAQRADGSPLGGASEPLACHVAAEVPGFDPTLWMPERDLARVPRVVPIVLAAAREALDGAHLIDLDLEARRAVHVVIGSGGGGFSFAEQQFTYWLGGETTKISPYAVSSTVAGMVSSEISLAYGLRGRSHTISDGCTSSTDAMGYALDLIRNGRAHTVVTGGADAPITPGTIAAFCLMRAVPTNFNDAPECASRPFDRDRAGFVLGEGAYIFVLEEAEHARARGATIWAEVAGYGATCEAFHRVALGEPDEAARAMTMALDDAGLATGEVDYVNLHGTATALNDPLETAAVNLALGDRARQIGMSATKSQVGHAQGASGAAGIAATLAAMAHGFLPPTINLDDAADGCDLDYVPRTSRPAQVDSSLCNCLGFGSKNGALVLKRYQP